MHVLFSCTCDVMLVSPFHAAKAAAQVLDHFRPEFIKKMDAGAVVPNLVNKGIIGAGDMTTYSGTVDPTQKNQLLHMCLRQKCTDDALRTVCEEIIDAGKRSNPIMKDFGEKMLNSLKTGMLCVCMCVGVLYTCMHAWVCLCMCTCLSTSPLKHCMQSPIICICLHVLETVFTKVPVFSGVSLSC